MTAINCDDPEHRENVVNSGHLFFDAAQAPNGKSDLLDGNKTQDALILLLEYLIAGGWHFEITSVNTDHPDDADLGTHCHNPCGFAVDGWPLTGPTPGAWLDAGDAYFQAFLTYMAGCPSLHQIGLAGTAQTAANTTAAGPTVFNDAGADHIHFGAQ
jgi:hypothetical protein